MGRYGTFTRIARDQSTLVTAYRRTLTEGGGRILLEDGAFSIDGPSGRALDPDIELYLGRVPGWRSVTA